MRKFFSTMGGIGLLLAGAGHAAANINYVSFPASTGLTLAGGASVAANVLRLTPSLTNRVGAAWNSTPQQVATGFTTTFAFRISSQSFGGGEGFAFVIQNSAVNAIGAGGCQLGYDPIPNSLAIEFDTALTVNCAAGAVNDSGDNQISIHTRGQLPNSAVEAASIGATGNLPDMSDGSVHVAKINYAPGTIDIYLDDMTVPRISAPLDLAATLLLNAGRAWVGFTGATSGATENHDIASWLLTEGAPPGTGRPRTPTITEPAYDGRVINAQDVHMETNAFFSPAGYAHRCTDWEIWTINPSERVWHTDCITGIERVHTHLGDGVFAGTYAGRRDLIPDVDYQLRARHRDTSGIAATEWSLYGTRLFHTAAAGANLAMLVEDVLTAPRFTTATGGLLILPAAATQSSVVLEASDGGLLLSITGRDNTMNDVVNPPTLTDHVEVRVRVTAGSGGLTLPPSNIQFLDEHCKRTSIYVPAVQLVPGEQTVFWVSAAGSTYVASFAQEHADLTVLARGSDTPYMTFQDGFVIERFAAGLQLPVNIAFVPHPGTGVNDPYFYVTELYGTIKMVTRAGVISDYRTGLLNFNPTGAFPGTGEQGLAGLAVDPDNGDVFASIVADDGTGAHIPRVLKFHSTDGGHTASTVTTILNMPNDPQGQSHQISNVSFGPDNQLYVHVGDGFDASTGQNLSMFRGKILRMNRAGGALPDNPFYNAADGITATDYVYAYGLRNPFGGGWRLSDSTHWTVENGPSVDRFSLTIRGRNYFYDGTDDSMVNYAIWNWFPAHAPVNITFIQQGVFGGSGFPPNKFEHAFVSESGPTFSTGPQQLGKRISEFVVDSHGVRISGPTTLIEYAGAGSGSVVGLAAGPDGLYFSDLYKDLNGTSPIQRGANIYRVRYAPVPPCCTTDFNGDGDVGTDADVEAFFACIAGNCCATCGTADFNQDGDVGTDADIEAFFRVLAGGPCN